MRLGRATLAITLFVSIALAGCLADRGDLALDARPMRHDASVDAPGDAGIACGEGQRVCGGACVDTLTDHDHCGGCDMPCGDGLACVAGTCSGCAGPSVYGVCGTGLRVWLDAQNAGGAGMPGADGPLSRWVNLAPGGGDAMADLGSPELARGAGERRVVRFEGARMTTPAIEGDGDSIEIFLVARARSLAAGTTLAFGTGTTASPLEVRLPDDGGTYLFGLPLDAQRLTAPFGRDVRQTTLWHAFGGAPGAEVRVDGTPVLRAAGGAALRYGAPLLLGANVEGRSQSLDVSELLVFDRPLSESDRAAITAALLARWELGSPAMPVPDGLTLWLDARTPLRDASPTDGDALARWDDRSPRAVSATTAHATYRADGLGPGRAAVELRRDEGESSVSFARPVSGDLTALVVLATDDGAGEGEGWSSANVLGADQRYPADDVALVLASGRVGVGHDLVGTPLSKTRIDDDVAHVVILRRTASDGRVRIWVDHELVVNDTTIAGMVTSPVSWYLGRHEDPSEGALAARYGEVLVYGRALADEELSDVERYLVRRWSTAPIGRQPPLDACVPGSGLACPVHSLAELRGAPSGRFWIDLGAGPQRVWIDASEGGGWALVLQYVHAANTDPELDVIQPGEDWPMPSPTALGGLDGVRSPRWGHVGASAAALAVGATELRWYGQTSAHPRVIHFRSIAGVDGWRRGVNEFAGIPGAHVTLTAGTAMLPGVATGFGYIVGPDTVLTNHPFYAPGFNWAVRGVGSRWEADDAAGPNNATIHRVWVR